LIDRTQAAVLRMSLERLDKVRTRAARCWLSGKSAVNFGKFNSKPPSSKDVIDVSSYDYFRFSLQQLAQTNLTKELSQALLEGYSSSAGMGSESVVQAARSALYDFLDTVPLDASTELVRFSLVDACNIFGDLLKETLSDDRVLLPLLDVIAFLLDTLVLQRLSSEQFRWRNFLSLIQKSHYKSNNIQKLHVALNVYRGLADVEVIRKEVLTKVSSMLLHPFPSIRVAAAETLFVVSNVQELKAVDWSQSTKALKEPVDNMKRAGVVV